MRIFNFINRMALKNDLLNADDVALLNSAHSRITDVLLSRIKKLEDDREQEREYWYVVNCFFDNHKELLPCFIEMCYRRYPEKANKMVEHFHDEIMDLSTINCSKKDFKSWDE